MDCPMTKKKPGKVVINFRFLDEHYELKYPQRLVEQAETQGLELNEFARQKLIRSLEDDRLDHLTALIEQLHSKVRTLEQTTDKLRKNQMKGIMAILIHVCDFSPDQAQRLLRGDAPE
jgi:Mg2+ and Co2+ transporter CorA